MHALIIADCADKANLVSQLAGLQSEIERLPAQMLGPRDNIPKYLADADDLQFCRGAPNRSKGFYLAERLQFLTSAARRGGGRVAMCLTQTALRLSQTARRC